MKRVVWAIAVSVTLLAASHFWAPVAHGVEPAQAFTNALREKEYYDIAVKYLDSVADNPAVPVQFKENLAYEKGITLVEGAAYVRDPVLHDKWLDQGQQVLQDFLKSNPESPLALTIRRKLGSANVSRATARMDKIKRQPTEEAKNKLRLEARALYAGAVKEFSGLVEETREKLKQYPAALPANDKRFEQVTQMRGEFLQAQILVAVVMEDLATTFPKGSPEHTKGLTDAAEMEKVIYENYRKRIAGLYARMYQGRCLQKLGKHKEALGLFEELLSNSESPDLHKLRLDTLQLAVKSWQEEKQWPQIIEKAGDAVETSQAKDNDMMELRVDLARSCKLYADELKAKNAKDPQIKTLLSQGRRLVNFVLRFPNSHQDQARKMLADFSGGDAEAAGARPKPKNFVEAHAAGKDAINKMQEAELVVKQVNLRLPTITDAAEKADLKKQVDDQTKIAAEARGEALEFLSQAVELSGREPPSVELTQQMNHVRYLLSFLSFTEAKYYESAVYGEYVSRRYPDSPAARQCASFAMKAYLRLHAEKKDDAKEYVARKVIEIASYIVKQWPDQAEAAEALGTLIQFMIREKRLTEAEEYLAKIPNDSPQRGNAELKMGQALWQRYQDGMREIREWDAGTKPIPEGVKLEDRKKELEEAKVKAKKTLIDGVGRMQAAGEVNLIVATAAMSLAYIYIDTGESDKAVALLEDAKIGPLTLVNKKDPIVQREGYAADTYKAALRAYISILGESKNPEAEIKKAEEMMAHLKELMAATPDGQSKLVQIYVALARELQAQMEMITEPQKKASVAKGFEVFLKKVGAEASDLKVLNWVAETYRAMGESFIVPRKTPPKQAMDYLGQAEAAYAKILAKGAKEPDFFGADAKTKSQMTMVLQLNLAKVHRASLKYKEAMDIYEAVLAANPSYLPVQMDAAKLLMEWASYGQPLHYRDAIVGYRPGKNNAMTIWGFALIANKTLGQSKFIDQFHEARYNVALCKYLWAAQEKDPAKQEDRFKKARGDIAMIVGNFDPSGSKWEKEYHDLLIKIQKKLKEPPIGLPALKKAAPAAPVKGAAASVESAPGKAAITATK